jgi:hypothetical protein
MPSHDQRQPNPPIVLIFWPDTPIPRLEELVTVYRRHLRDPGPASPPRWYAEEAERILAERGEAVRS